MGIDIIKSSILSPSKLSDVQLNFKLTKDFLIGEEDIRSTIIEIVSEFIDDEYQLADKLPSILHEVLASTGAAPHLFINEAVVDDIVNADIIANLGMEDYMSSVDMIKDSFSSPLGIITPDLTKGISLEVYDETLGNNRPKSVEEIKTPEEFVKYLIVNNTSLTDNSRIVSYSQIKERLRSTLIRSSLRSGRGISLESNEKISYLDLARDRRKDAEIKYSQIIHTKNTATREGIGRPMVKQIPTEAVAPIFSPGDKDNHLGYLIVLDESGKPVSGDVSKSSFERLNNSIHKAGGGSPLTRVYQDLIKPADAGGACVDIEALYEMYKEIVENQIYESFKDSLYGEYVELENNDNIYYIMFCRALQSQQTNILYVPKESLVYFSVENSELGIGKTLLDNLTMLASMRAMLLYARVMAEIKNAIDITDVDVELDPDDPNPEQTIEMIRKKTSDVRNARFPIGIIEPHGITEWLQSVGMNFRFSNHPDIPNIKISYEKSALTHELPSSDSEENLQKQLLRGLGVSPEVIETAYSPEFAAGYLINNDLYNRRIRMLQKAVNPNITKFVANVIYNDYRLRDKIKEELEGRLESLKEYLTEEEKALLSKDTETFYKTYIDTLSRKIYVELPEIPTTNADLTTEEYSKYSDKLDSILDVICNRDMFEEEVIGEGGANLDMIKASLKAMFLRRWAGDNNYMPEVFGLISEDEDTNKETVGSLENHFTGMMSVMVNLLNTLKDVKKASNQDLAKIKEESEMVDDEDDEY